MRGDGKAAEIWPATARNEVAGQVKLFACLSVQSLGAADTRATGPLCKRGRGCPLNTNINAATGPESALTLYTTGNQPGETSSQQQYYNRQCFGAKRRKLGRASRSRARELVLGRRREGAQGEFLPRFPRKKGAKDEQPSTNTPQQITSVSNPSENMNK